MATSGSAGRPGSIGFLRNELAPFPGRWNPVLRTLISSALVIVISMTLQVPFLALSLIMVFFITQANAAVTRMVGMMFVIGIPLSTVIGVLLLKYTFGYPLIRIVVASAIFCGCMFFLRVSRFSLMFFVLAFVTIYVQSLVDLVPDPESLLRTNLWVGAATLYAVMITLLINTFFLPIEPAGQLNQLMQQQLSRVRQQLLPQAGTAPLTWVEVHKAILGLHKLLRFSAMRNEAYLRYGAYYQVCIVCICRLLMAATALPANLKNAQRDELIENIERLGICIANREAFFPQLSADAANAAPALVEMRHALMDAGQAAPWPDETRVPGKEPFMVADALSNPVYLRFVVKACFAALLCYVFYTGVQWPGIHTIMLTSVITSLPNLGASAQKGILRIAGCLVGALLAIVAMVFVVPHLDSLFGLLAMSLSVVAISAWVCAGSDRSAYAGTQIIFCFALALLEDFGPVYDLTLIRDRLIGIVLGVLITTAIQTFVWPENEAGLLLKKLSGLLQNIEKLAQAKPATSSLSLACWNQIADCEAMLLRIRFEPALGRDIDGLVLATESILCNCREMIIAAHINIPVSDEQLAQIKVQLDRVSAY